MRKIIFIIPLILCFLISFMVINFGDSERTIFENSINDYIIKTNALTMMYETKAGSGEYTVASDNTWPQDGYIFNERLSSCENASKLIWDDDAKKVLLQANTSDKCYVYFDKYNMPYVNNVEATEVTSDSITVNVTASGGDGSIVNYYYSINGGEYILSSNNVYTFENLTAETSYNISVFVTDSNGRKSSVSDNIIFTKTGVVEIVSYSLGLSHESASANYLKNVVTDPPVEVEKYVLELSNGSVLETNKMGEFVWPSCSPSNVAYYLPNRTYSYVFYLITVDGIKSLSVSGTLNVGVGRPSCSLEGVQ